MVFLVIFLWLCCALFSAMIGASKGALFPGLIVGLLFGPLGVIISLLSRSGNKRCPYCKEFMHDEATTCPHCQKDV